MKRRILFAVLAFAMVVGAVSSSTGKMVKPDDPIACAGQGNCTVEGTAYLIEACTGK